jgi:outer membrane lipoprotein carrier protein
MVLIRNGQRLTQGVAAVLFVLMVPRLGIPANPPSGGGAMLMDQVQKKYSSITTFQSHFVQKFSQGKDQHLESGVLYLSRGGKMRWDYTQPESKLFLVDGKSQFTWIPAENRVYRESFKTSDDERKPILLLLGRLSWRKVFSRVEQVDLTPGDETTVWLRAYPKNESLGYDSVTLQVEKNTLHLLRISIDNMDRSKMEFSFSEIVENPQIDPQKFSFRIPRGAEVVEP